MTYEEAVKLLMQLRCKRAIVNRLRARIEEVRQDYSAIASGLSGIGSKNADCMTKAEMLVDKVLEVQKRYETALNEFLELESRLYDNFYDLNEEERYVVLESYMSGKPAWKIGNELGYSERTIKRRRVNAIKKICKN